MSTNKSVVVASFGAATPDLRVEEREIPVPGEGEVLVKITHRPINPADIFSVLGVYPGFKAKKLPAAPGLDGVGKVAKNGPGASKFAVGQRVVGVPAVTPDGEGTWQQYAVFAEENLFGIPDDVDDYQASQFYVNPHTAFGFFETIEREKLAPEGGWVLSNAASSALGFQVTRLAKKRGYKIANVVRSAKWVEPLKAAGADVVVVAGEQDVAEAVKAATGGAGVDVAFEPVGGDGTAAIVSSVRSGGTVFVYGAMSGLKASFSIPDVLFRYVSIRGWWLSAWIKNEFTAAEREKVHADVAALIADGTLAVEVGASYKLDQFQEALAEAGRPGRNEKAFFVE